MDDLDRQARRLLWQRFRAAVEMAITLRRDGTPLATALQQGEQRMRSTALPAGLDPGVAAAAEAERATILDLIQRARLDPERACAGQDPLDWLAMAAEDRLIEL